MNEDTLRPCTESKGNPDDLIALAEMRMPFGKYKGSLLIDLPEPYIRVVCQKRISGRKTGSHAADGL